MTLAAPARPLSLSGSITREDILQLGSAGRPWDFLPAGLAALKVAPVDAAVRFLLAANFARLGLTTAAEEQVAALAELGVPKDHPDVQALRSAMGQMPGDRIAPQRVIDTCRLNVETLAARGTDLWPEFERWRLAQAGCEWFRTLDGNILRRRGEAWPEMGDHKGAAAAFARRHLANPEPFPMYILEGANPPWVLQELAAALPEGPTGVRPLLVIVQADALEFLDGLSLADLTPTLRHRHTRLFVGPRAPEELGRWLQERTAYRMGGPCIPLHAMRRRCDPPVEAVIRQAQAEQARQQEALAAEVAQIYAGRDRAFWVQRYAQALTRPSAAPLRVLLRTTRYSTYMQHAARDLAEAFRAAGHAAELLIEPDDQTQLAPIADLQALRDFQPDLLILINYMRCHMGPWIPPQLPFVCWIQDSLPHQFSFEAAAAQGPMDFLVGHLHPELFSQCGFTRERTLSLPVMVSQTKFHAAPVDPGLRRRLECEIAFVSHHSETPEQMHARLIFEAASDRASARVMERLYPDVQRIACDCTGEQEPMPRLAAAVEAAVLAETGRQESPQVMTALLRQYALPLGERMARHQALHWAADIAEQRGWRLKVFGRGWEGHPRFASFAAGSLEHGDELRACYQSAAAHLHISITALIHQRIMECALSGGLPVCRLTDGTIEGVMETAEREAWLHAPPGRFDAATGKHAFTVADHPALLQAMALRQRLGLRADPVFWSEPVNLERLKQLGNTPLERRPDWVLGDLAELTFRTPQELERVIARAVEAPAWRSGWSGLIAGRVRQRLTLASMVRQVLALVQGSFGTPGE